MVDMYDHPSQFEPLLISSDRPGYRELIGLAEQLVEASAKLEAIVPVKTALGLRELVTGMNCYYSNLIEGHHTRPLDIEKAMQRDYLGDKNQLNIKHLAEAYIETAHWAVDKKIGSDISITSFLCETHRRFCSGLPSSMLVMEDGTKVVPGDFRRNEVSIGRHIPPKHEVIGNFLDRFDSVYSKVLSTSSKGGLNKLEAISASLISHHRLVWVHPFADGNGRVARIALDAMLRESGLPSIGLWSLSRGFAKAEKEYKAMLDAADEPRMGALDGRGNLSEKRTVDFAKFSMGIAIDQVKFMSQMFSLDKMEQRCWQYFNVMQDQLRPEAAYLYIHAFQKGEIERGEVGRVMGLGERTSRDVLGEMLKNGLLLSDTPKGKVRVGFPLFALGTLFPNLYPAGDLDIVESIKILPSKYSGVAAGPGRYSGNILDVDIKNNRVLQKVGRDPEKVVWHELSKFKILPQVGSSLDIIHGEDGAFAIKQKDVGVGVGE